MVANMKECADCMSGKHCQQHVLSKKIQKQRDDFKVKDLVIH